MTKRKITNTHTVKFEPFDNYGSPIKGMSWHKISYDRENGGQGSYLLKMNPGAKSLPHTHTGYEEFLMLEGELTDPDGQIFKSITLLSPFRYPLMCPSSSKPSTSTLIGGFISSPISTIVLNDSFWSSVPTVFDSFMF